MAYGNDTRTRLQQECNEIAGKYGALSCENDRDRKISARTELYHYLFTAEYSSPEEADCDFDLKRYYRKLRWYILFAKKRGGNNTSYAFEDDYNEDIPAIILKYTEQYETKRNPNYVAYMQQYVNWEIMNKKRNHIRNNAGFAIVYISDEEERQRAERLNKPGKHAVLSEEFNEYEDCEECGSSDAGKPKDKVEIMFIDIMEKVLNLTDHLTKKQNTESRKRLFRMFYTDQCTYILQTITDVWGLPGIINRERDIINAMALAFLDFYLTEEVRTVDKIARCPRKTYGQLFGDDAPKGKEDSRLVYSLKKARMESKVYMKYFEDVEQQNVSDASISIMFKEYNAFLKAVLQC